MKYVKQDKLLEEGYRTAFVFLFFIKIVYKWD